MARKSKIKIKPYSVPPYIREALEILRPPEQLTVSEWAEKYRILDDKTSARPGHWRNEIIRLVYFRQSHNLHGAAQKCFVSFRTAQRWQRDFFDIVERELGLK